MNIDGEVHSTLPVGLEYHVAPHVGDRRGLQGLHKVKVPDVGDTVLKVLALVVRHLRPCAVSLHLLHASNGLGGQVDIECNVNGGLDGDPIAAAQGINSNRINRILWLEIEDLR